MPPRRKAAPAGPIEIRCPICTTDLPLFPMVDLFTYTTCDGVLSREKTGERVCCQNCAAVFSIGPHGIFHHDRRALPLSHSGAPAPEPAPEGPPGTQAPDLGRSLLPLPRRKASV